MGSGEGIEGGRTAGIRLNELGAELDTACGWSTYDTFFGGGMVSSAIKQDHMDRAASLSRSADHALASLRRELRGVGVAGVGESLAMTGGTRFLDTWFDNIFTDLGVRVQINDAKDRTRRVGHQLGQVLQSCQQRFAATETRLGDISTARRPCWP